MDDRLLRSLPGIRFLHALPGGTYGPAFLGEHLAQQRNVVVQLLAAKWAHPRDTSLQSLHAHADVLKKLQIPSTLPLLEVGCHEGRIYWVTDWAVGRPLPMPSGRLGGSAALAAVRPLLGALFRAHEAGIGHFALRPSQVVLELRSFRAPRLRLHGLGLAAILDPPIDAFAPEARVFLAPEVRNIEAGLASASPAADVYSLAMIIRTLFELYGEPSKTHSSSRGMPTALFLLLTDMLAVQPSARPTLSQVSERFLRIVEPSGKTGGPQRRLPMRVDSPETVPDPAVGTNPTVLAPLPNERTPIPNQDPLLGQQFGSFRLTKRLGSGAMGAVYEAAHVRIGHRAAVKVLHPQFAESSEFARRFLDEAKAVNIVEHQGIVSIFDFGQRTDGSLYIVMEYLRGRTLDTLLHSHRSGLDFVQAIDLLDQLSSALAAAHQKGIVHRDVKPSNLMLIDDPLVAGSVRLKILDFGIAKLSEPQREVDPRIDGSSDSTAYGQVLGTPMYMAPEQYGTASDVTGEADVFAVGAVFFEMLTGAPPFGETASFRVVSETAPRVRSRRPSVPTDIDDLIATMLSAKPEDRPSMSAVLGQIQRYRKRSNGGVIGRSNRLLFLAALAMVMGGGWALHIGVSERADPDPYPTYAEARSTALLHIRKQQESNILSNQQSATHQLVRGHERADLGFIRRLIGEAPIGSGPWEEAVAAVGVLSDYASRPLLREKLQPVEALAKKSCEWVRADPLSKQQFLLASSLLLLQDQSGLDVLRSYLRCYPQERPGLELDAALRLLWQDVPESHALTPPPWAMLRKIGPWQVDNLDALERTLLLQGDVALEESIRWLRNEESLHKTSSLAIRRVLARLGDPASEQLLEQLAAPSSARRLEAAEALIPSRPGDTALCSVLRTGLSQTLTLSQKRELVEALALCPQLETVTQLLLRLRDHAEPLAFRDAVAGSLLQLLPPAEPSRANFEADLLVQCQGTLAADKVRCLDALIEQQDGSASDWIHKQWASSSVAVRVASVRQIGRARLLQSLDTLRLSLQDADTDVRIAGERALVDIFEAVDKQAASLPAAIQKRLEELATAGDDSVRIIAQVILLRLGDTRGQASLFQALDHPSEKIRQLLIEVVPAQHPILVRALSDGSVVVRLFAAHRLAQSGDKRAIPVLRELLNGRGAHVLLAYMDLRRLGQQVDRPLHLPALLTTRDLTLRFAAAQTLRYLKPKEAAPFLLQLMYDSSDVIRKEVLRCASALYKRDPLPMLRLILDRFLNDQALAVRLLAIRLRDELGLNAQVALSKPLPVKHTPTANSMRDGESSVPPVAVVEGGAVITAVDRSGLATEAVIKAESFPTFAQSMEQLRTALRSRNLVAAQKLMGQLRRRSGLSTHERSDLDLADAEMSLHEYQVGGRTPVALDQAANKVNSLFERSNRSGLGESQKQRLSSLYQLLKPLVVTVHIGAQRDGKCQKQGVILMPRVQQIDAKVWPVGSEVWRGCDPRK